jgi:hypothetical protein
MRQLEDSSPEFFGDAAVEPSVGGLNFTIGETKQEGDSAGPPTWERGK